MEVEVTLLPGSKGPLVAILRALKDLNRSNTLSLRFSEDFGLQSHFSCGPSGDAKAAFASFRLFAAPSPALSATSATAQHDQLDHEHHNELLNPNARFAAQLDRFPKSHVLAFLLPHNPPHLASLFAALACNPEVVNTNDDMDDGLVVTLSVHPKTMFHQMELVDEFDRVSLRSEKAEAGCELYFESLDLGRKVLYEMDFVPNKIDPIVHRLPTPPPAGYAFVVQIEAKEYVRTIAALHDASDRVTIKGGKNSIMFESSGPNGTLQVGLSQKTHAQRKPIPRFKILYYAAPGIEQTFNTRYLLAFAHAVHLGTTVLLSFPPNPSSPVLAALAQASAGSRAPSPHGSRPESPYGGAPPPPPPPTGSATTVSPLRAAHSHLRISHPIEVVGLAAGEVAGLGGAAEEEVFKLATSLTTGPGTAASTALGATVSGLPGDALLEGRKVVGVLEYFLAPESQA
ncbi:hypothetical protein BC830DRAFT_1080049 [Chytriomyces sp. MP71]|nr:hypothetical protein BC830DRAFT_1080049 [Chytriomyces sp. MP71]